jgi:phosphatidate cytidylyltransferase
MMSWHREHPVHHGLAGVGLLVLLLIVLPIGVAELTTLFTAEQVRPYPVIASFGCGALVLHAFLTQLPKFEIIAGSSLALIVVFVMLLSAGRRAWDRQSDRAIVRMAGTVLATLYLGGLAWFLMAIRVKHSVHFSGSTMGVLMILLVVKFTDIGAYFGGRALGRHKLIVWLSPGKTWEGLVCGMLTAGVVGMICASFVTDIQLSPHKGFIFGVIIGGIGQVGDLMESLMKRDAEVKDSGRLIPGFGGILDVMDSPLFAAPFAYLLLSLFALRT